MPSGIPSEAGEGYEGKIRGILEGLGKTSQGIFILHHGILVYREWPFWSDLVGIGNRETRSVHHDLNLHIEVSNPDHPITRGLEAWDMVDETYVMDEPEEENGILLSVDHPQSMKAIA